MSTKRDPAIKQLLQRMDLLTVDGMPLVWATRWHGAAVPERVTGADLVPLLAQRCAAADYSMYLVGSGPGIADEAASILRETNPGLEIAVSSCAFFESVEDMDQDVLAEITEFAPDILLVALGHPKQEHWGARYGTTVNARVVIGVGGSLDFLTGATQRAPLFMRRAGLEWAHRLMSDPGRLGPRYARDLIEFLRHLHRPVDLVRYGSLAPSSEVALADRLAQVEVDLIVARSESINIPSDHLTRSLVVDLGPLVRIDIGVIALLLTESRRRWAVGAELFVLGEDPRIEDYFRARRLDTLLTYCPTVEDVLRRVWGRTEHG